MQSRQRLVDVAVLSVEQPPPDVSRGHNGHNGRQKHNGAEEPLAPHAHVQQQRGKQRGRQRDWYADDSQVEGVEQALPEQLVREQVLVVAKADELWILEKVEVGEAVIGRRDYRDQLEYQEADDPG